MTDLILHHFDASPFAEKVRKVAGIKNLSWKSVQIPMVMPKPNLMPLTGGYRKTPVLQIGAEIYCDTNLIMRELDLRYPQAPLFGPPGGLFTAAFAHWSDKAFFEPGAALSMALNQQIPQPLLNDRKAFFKFMDFDSLQAQVPHMWGQFLAQVRLLEAHLSDGRHYLGGDSVSCADVYAWFPLWMVRANVPGSAEQLDAHASVVRWEARLQAFGYGQSEALTEQDALEVARAAMPEPGAGCEADPLGLSVGATVSVVPTDYGAVPVQGQLIGLNSQQVSLRRQHPAVGEVNVHFPRVGYEVLAG